MNAQSPQHAFVYGTLMFPNVMQRVCGHTPSACPATLHGYKRSPMKGRTYPAISPNTSAEIRGILYTDISLNDIQNLDTFEGDEYVRKTVEVVLEDHTRLRAWAYVIHPDHSHKLTDEDWHPENFEAQDIEAFIKESCP